MRKKFVAIGHIVNNTEPIDHLGGSVAYTAVAAKKLGFDAHIITKSPPKHIYLDQLRSLGITVHFLPSSLSTITTLKSKFDEKGKREEKCLERQEIIGVNDFPLFPKDIIKDALLVIGTIIGEVDVTLYPLLAKYGMLAAIPQGYFRTIDQQGIIKHKKWNIDPEYLRQLKIVVVSDEDLTIDDVKDIASLEMLKQNIPIVVLTQRESGSTIYHHGEEIHIQAFHLEKNEIKDFTGAGDIYTTAFFTRYNSMQNLKEAGVFASFYAALKINGFDGIGIDSVPGQGAVRKFIKKNKDRVDAFLKANAASEIVLL